MATAADILYLARKKRGLSQRELSRVSGVGQPKISAYERGQVVPRFDVLEKLVGHCGSRLVVRLEDNSYPRVPSYGMDHRLSRLQWAVSRRPGSSGILDVRAVPPRADEVMAVLVREGATRWRRRPKGVAELEAYLRRVVGNVEVVDLDAKDGATKSRLLEGSVPVAFVGRSRPYRETRFEPPEPDRRWYATRVVDGSPGRLYGPRKPRGYLAAFLAMGRYRRFKELEERALLVEERERASDEELWRGWDERGTG